MGREIRRVPKGWEHPKKERYGKMSHAPLYDKSFRQAADDWKRRFAAWESGEDEDKATHPDMEFWEWDGGPPDREYYRPDWKPEEMTHYQMYETVSEGTPVSPVFETTDQLCHWLMNEGGYSREASEAFIKTGWAPSMSFSREEGIKMNLDALV